MDIDIYDVLECYVQDNKLVFLKDASDLWDSLIERCSIVPLQYSVNMIRYQEAYFTEKTGFYQDISLIIMRGGIPIGLWPLCIYKKANICYIGSLGQEVAAPILIDGWGTVETKRAVFDECILILKQISFAINASEIYFSETVMGEGISIWNHKLMEGGVCYKEMKNVLFYDLTMPEDEVGKRLRRTNKYSIKKGYSLFDTELVTKSDPEFGRKFDVFRKYHIKISGRETRSKRTWDEQENGIRVGNDFLVLLYEKDSHAFVGGALFTVTNSVGLYAVAAYDRTLFDKPVGHIAQDVAIKHMRNLRLRWYEIGDRFYECDTEDKKLINISHYKEGFATHSYYKVTLELKL